MSHQFYTADVFTERPFGGNQLAVFPDADRIPERRMQQVAQEFRFSETVFVLRSEHPDCRRRLRIFTPQAEIPFSGHPTVGTAAVLVAIHHIPTIEGAARVVFEEGIGPVEVGLRVPPDRPIYGQLRVTRPPEIGPSPPAPELLAEMLALEPSDLLLETRPPAAVSCGMPYLFVPLRDLGAVRRARLKLDLWERHLEGFWAPNVYVFAHEAELDDADVHARMFAPAYGVAEDPATGSAATALGGLLGLRSPERDGTLRWTVEQGLEIDRPSLLDVEVDKRDGEVVEIRVGGSTVMMSRGEMEIPA